MKIKKYIKTTFLVIVAACAASSLTAMEPEFEKANLTTARLKGSEYKRQAASALPALLGTDTMLLVEGITDGNNDKYVAFAKAGIKGIVGPWIDGLLVANNAFLAKDPGAGVTVGATSGTRRKKNNFKLKLDEIIDTAALGGVAQPADAKLRSLKVTKDAVNAEIARVVNVWIDTLPVNGGNLIVVGVKHDGLAGAPTDQTPAAFKTALENLIKTF
jgi:hypothetical protein